MEYTVVEDPEAAGKAALTQTALQKDEIAFQAEFNLNEAQSIPEYSEQNSRHIRNLAIDAASKRRQADAYISASEVSPALLAEKRLEFLHRLLHAQEHSHVAHSAELKVKESLGEPSASYDSILAALDRGHSLALKMIAEIEGQITN